MAAKYEAKRREAAENLFVESVTPAVTRENTVISSDSTLVQKYTRLEKLHRQELSKWWEAVSLQKYLDCQRVPRGLRIFTTPTFENPKPAMLNDWTINSNKCTTGMLKILIQYAWSDRQEILDEIDRLILEIKSQEPSREEP